MTFGESINTCFSQYSNFYGRASLSEFWWWYLFYILGTLVLYGLVVGLMIATDSPVVSILILIWVAIMFIPTLGVLWRRLHDTGRSGGWYFISLIPFVGFIILLVFLCQPSQPFANLFGDVPSDVQVPYNTAV